MDKVLIRDSFTGCGGSVRENVENRPKISEIRIQTESSENTPLNKLQKLLDEEHKVKIRGSLAD